MKFLCDRCKTRYSIADERVRGKILKIRCKNCSNVITVREGMPEPEPESAEQSVARRVTRPTDYSPAVVQSGPQPAVTAPALQQAFAQAMEKPAAPPSQLEEEWYVSIDGDQSGPFSLAEAQAWVGARRIDDELFCWCEGFDDWLPVEKVSHFRGLRKPVTPAPRAATARPVPPPPGARKPGVREPAGPRELDDEPKPLFAAALAALEAEVGTTAQASAGAALPTASSPVPPSAAKAPPRAPTPVPPPAAKAPPLPSVSPSGRGAALPTPAPALARATPVGGTPARPATPPTGKLGFDDSDAGGATGDAAPAAPFRLDDLAGAGGAADDEADDAGGDDDLAIGEVSRVVRLTDIAAQARRPAASKGRSPTGRTPAIVAPAALAEAAAPASPLAEAAAESLQDEHAAISGGDHPAAVLAPVTRPPPRRQQAVLLAGGAVLLLAIVGLVVFFAAGTGEDDDGGGGGGGGTYVDNLARTIDDPRYPRAGRGSGDGSGQADPGTGSQSTKKPTSKRPVNTGNGGGSMTTGTGPGTGPGTGKTERVVGPDGQVLEPLSPDDVVTQALKMSSGTQRCYQRALKDDPFLKVKSIAALISVNAAGQVTDVSLDQMSSTNLGKCLIAAIKRWPFRRSTAGIDTKITLKFEQTL